MDFDTVLCPGDRVQFVECVFLDRAGDEEDESGADCALRRSVHGHLDGSLKTPQSYPPSWIKDTAVSRHSHSSSKAVRVIVPSISCPYRL